MRSSRPRCAGSMRGNPAREAGIEAYGKWLAPVRRLLLSSVDLQAGFLLRPGHVLTRERLRLMRTTRG